MSRAATCGPTAVAGGGTPRRRRRLVLRAVSAVAVVAVAPAALLAAIGSASDGRADDLLWAPRLPEQYTLISNEVAFRQPHRAEARTSPDWIVTSGSLFGVRGTGFTGAVDGESPDVASRVSTGSAVLRAVSARSDFGDVRVSIDLDVAGLTTTRRSPAHDYDGVHLLVRYRTPGELYAVSVCRRDGTIAVKKKAPGSAGDGSGYTTLARAELPCRLHRWQTFAVVVRDRPVGVELTLFAGGVPVISGVDEAAGGVTPLRGAGRVGIRGDNSSFHFRDLQVRALG